MIKLIRYSLEDLDDKYILLFSLKDFSHYLLELNTKDLVDKTASFINYYKEKKEALIRNMNYENLDKAFKTSRYKYASHNIRVPFASYIVDKIKHINFRTNNVINHEYARKADLKRTSHYKNSLTIVLARSYTVTYGTDIKNLCKTSAYNNFNYVPKLPSDAMFYLNVPSRCEIVAVHNSDLLGKTYDKTETLYIEP